MNKRKLISERCWQNYGSLAGCIARLDNIARSDTTLLDEKLELLRAIDLLNIVLSSWKPNYSIAKEKINGLK